MPVKMGGSGDYEFTEIEEGEYLGVCVAWINFGKREDTFTVAGKQQTTIKNESILYFELPEVVRETDDGQVPMIVKTIPYNTTWGGRTKSNLRKLLEAWRVKELTPEEIECFEFERLKYAHAKLVVGPAKDKHHRDYNKIHSITKWRGEKLDESKIHHKWRMFDWDLIKSKEQADATMADWEDFIKERIQASHQYQAFLQNVPGAEQEKFEAPSDDDVPF